MRPALRKAIAQAKMRGIRRELDNLDCMRAQSSLGPIERPDDTYVTITITEREGKLLRDLERLSEILDCQGVN